ncbi:hypothetical protein [Listeria seeligeri]|uniref:hypothetical protein n=1 Tax=Listeria seeligeri TaxID=1640 RepID=UPI002F41F2EE
MIKISKVLLAFVALSVSICVTVGAAYLLNLITNSEVFGAVTWSIVEEIFVIFGGFAAILSLWLSYMAFERDRLQRILTEQEQMIFEYKKLIEESKAINDKIQVMSDINALFVKDADRLTQLIVGNIDDKEFEFIVNELDCYIKK